MTAPKFTPDTPATRRAFNRLAREKNEAAPAGRHPYGPHGLRT